MSNGNSYLNITRKEATPSTKSTEETDNSLVDDEDEEEAVECYTLVPRSSPVPRKRGLSVFDETVEYMRTRLSLPSRRVSFIDSQGGDLVEVREFVAFDSDEEEDPRWEVEDARYRPAPHEPIYQVCPDFEAPSSTDLMLAVQKNKIEMESLSSIEHDPLSFTGLIRVLNICFNKAVYVRFTMDSWRTFFDCPADYVVGSNDVETDQYSFKLSFAAPFTTHGSRIEFVLRYETPEGDYWANNDGKNYAVVLHVSFADDALQKNGMDKQNLKSILKPARKEEDNEETLAADSAEEDSRSTETKNAAPKRAPVLPQFVQPKIDIESKDARPSSPSKTDTDLRIVDSVPLCASTPPSEAPLSFSAVERVEVFTPITTQPLTTQPEPESPQKVDFTKHDWVLKEQEDVPASHVYSYTKTQNVVHKGIKTTINVSSQSTIIYQPAAPELIPLPCEEDGHEKDPDVVEGESNSEPPYEIKEKPISTSSPYEDPYIEHTLETEPDDQSTQDGEGYLGCRGAFQNYQSDKLVIADLGPLEEQSETDPEGELCALRAAVMGSFPGGKELADLDATCPATPPICPEPAQSEEDRLSESPAEPVTVPFPAPALHFLQDELAAKFDELDYEPDPTVSLLESPVASVEEVGHALLETTREIAPPDSVVLPTLVNTADVIMQSVSQTYSHVPDQGFWEEHAEEYSCPPGLPAPLGIQGLEHEKVAHQRATELAVSQNGQFASHLRRAYVASSVFMIFVFCVVLAFHHPHILPLVLLYFISICL